MHFYFYHNIKALMKLRGEVSLYKPPPCLKVPRVNVLLVGQVGSGKSSFINTVNSVFKGHVTSRATAGSTEHSLTTMVSTSFFNVFSFFLQFKWR